MRVFAITLQLLFSSTLLGQSFTTGTTAIKFGVHEVVLAGNGSVPNPFDTVATVTFTPQSGSANSVTVRAFYDGGNTWRARAYVSEAGSWNWTSSSATDSQLDEGSGSFTAADSNLPGILKKDVLNPRAWRTDSGKWFVPIRGINVVRHDLSELQTAESRLIWILNNNPGVYVQSVLFGADQQFAWSGYSQSVRNNTMDYMIARWSAFPNLYWLISQDQDASLNATLNFNREVGRYFKSHEPWKHLLSTEFHSSEGFPLTGPDDLAWLDYAALQEPNGPGATQIRKYHLDTLPVQVQLGEDVARQSRAAYSDPGFYFRWGMWSWILSGGAYIGLDSNAHVWSYFQSRDIDLSRFQPDDNLVTAWTTRRGDAWRPKLMRRGSEEFLVYDPHAFSEGVRSELDHIRTASMTIDLASASGAFVVEWYRPYDGTAQTGGTVQGGASRTFTAPWPGSDVVLRIVKSGPDVSPPAISIIGPAHNSPVAGTITISANASDNIGVAGVQFQLDGMNFGAEDVIAPWSVSWDTKTARDGLSHTITAIARDAAGNTAAASPVSVIISNPTNRPRTARPAAATAADGPVSYGLEWPGDGAVRRMLYWHNPFPIYDATYVFKVYPRKKTTGPYRYYTTFFWGNDGTFVWDGGNANTYYGAHPYPVPAPAGPGQWEISVNSNDYVTGSEVQWDRWYTQAFRAWRESPSITHHEFYWDWPDTSKVISQTIIDPNWASGNPPTPAIVMGQAPDLNGASWGGYPGWEEFKGIIRGIQIYSGLLSMTDLEAEINSPKSTTAGLNLIWYLNTDPRPSDVTDKKATGTAHNPSWSGTTALEWSDQSSPDTTPPSTPANLTATAVSSSQINLSWTASTDNVGVTGYRVERCQGTGCSNFAQIATPASASFNDTGLAANTSYSYRVRATDAAMNLSGYSNVASATTPNQQSGNGLVAAYGFNEGTGTSAPDSSGNNNTGTISGAAWTTQGKYGSALNFNGTSNLVLINNSASLNLGSAMTLEAWIYPTASQSGWRTIIQRETDAYILHASNDSGPLRPAGGATVGSALNYVVGPAANPVNAWTHLAVTYNGSTIILYVNGSAVASAAAGGSIETNSNPLRIGGNVPYGEYFHGRIDEVRIYNRALTQTEIQTDMNSPVAPDTIPPSAPSNLAATAASASQINLTWTAATDSVGVTGYLVERCQGAGCSNFAQIATPATTSFSDTGLTANTSYSYRVRATDAANNLSGYSNTASATTTGTTPPTAPTNLTATASGGTQINLSWTASSSSVGILNYQVERCQGSGCSNFVQIATPTATSYADTGLTSATTYSYRVRASDTNNVLGGYSNTASATTADTVAPSVPSNLTATASGTSQINLSWTASTDNVGVTGYRVERCQGVGCSSFAQIATPATASYSDTVLASGTTYQYRVRAADAAINLSGYSSTAAATTLTGPPPNGPAAAYGFNEGTGSTTADGSGNGLTGTLTNGPAWTSGQHGGALSFDGVNDKVSLPGTLDIPVLPITLEAWVRPVNFSTWHVIFSKRNSYSAAGMRVDVGLQTSTGSVYVTTYTSTVTFTYAPPLNTWTHLAVVADSTGTRLYVNGVLQQTLGVVTLGTGSSAAVNIGRTGDNDDPFAGSIDDLRLYKRVLSQTEIQTDMNAGVN